MNVQEYFERAFDKQQSGLYEEAILEYNKALELDRYFERAYVQRAYCYSELKNFAAALDDYKIAMIINPNDPRTYFNAGSMVYYLDLDTKDTSYLDKAIVMDPDDMAEAYFLRGLIRYFNICSYRLAIDDFTKSIEQGCFVKTCYSKIANCYRFLDDFDNALLNYYKVLELDPVSDYATVSAYGNIGYIKHLHELYYEAMEYYMKAKAMDPSYDELDEYIEKCEEAIKNLC